MARLRESLEIDVMPITATGQAPGVWISTPSSPSQAGGPQIPALPTPTTQPGPFQQLSADLQAVLLQVQQSQALQSQVRQSQALQSQAQQNQTFGSEDA
jgi:hypothetical protein